MTENQNPAERIAHAGSALEAEALVRTVEEQRATISNMETETARVAERYSAHLSDLRSRIASLENERIDVNDARIAHHWRKASRIASNAGFCSEYERVAESIGLEPVEHRFTATATLAVMVHVPIDVVGNAHRSDITSGEIDADNIDTTIDREAVATVLIEHLANSDVNSVLWSVDDYSIYSVDDVAIDDDGDDD
jgi:hypothetical protein